MSSTTSLRHCMRCPSFTGMQRPAIQPAALVTRTLRAGGMALDDSAWRSPLPTTFGSEISLTPDRMLQEQGERVPLGRVSRLRDP